MFDDACGHCGDFKPPLADGTCRNCGGVRAQAHPAPPPTATAASRPEGELLAAAVAGMRAVLELLGADPSDLRLGGTPERAVAVMLSLGAAPGELEPDPLEGVPDRPVDGSSACAAAEVEYLCALHLQASAALASVAWTPAARVDVGRLAAAQAMGLLEPAELARRIAEAVVAAGAAAARCLLRVTHPCPGCGRREVAAAEAGDPDQLPATRRLAEAVRE